MGNPFAPGGPNNANPFQQLFFANGPRPAAAAAAGAEGAQNNAAAAPQQEGGATRQTASPAPAAPPFGLPPFMPPFLFMPLVNPPPVVPPNLRSLGVDELRRLEGGERENIEARIECLRNIQVRGKKTYTTASKLRAYGVR